MRRLVLFFLPFLVVASAPAQVPVSGRLVGDAGTPMPVAHVELHPYLWRGQSSAHRVVTADAAGTYRLDVPEPGLYRLRFSGPLHGAYEVVLYAEDTTPVSLDVQLQREWLDADQSFTRVTTAASGFEYNEGVPLARQPDGSYAATVAAPGDTLFYELPGAPGTTFAGQVFGSVTADGFRYLGEGTYRYLVHAPGDSVSVVLRPAMLPVYEPPPPMVTFGPENTRARAYAAFHRAMRDRDSEVFQRALRVRERTGEVLIVEEDKDRENARRRAVEALETRIAAAPDAFERQLALLEYLYRGTFSSAAFVGRMLRLRQTRSRFEPMMTPRPEIVEQVLGAVPPTSLLWITEPALLQSLVETLGERADVLAYLERVIAAHPHEDVRRFALENLFEGAFARHGLTDETRAYAQRLVDTFGFEGPIFEASKRKIVPGRRVPERYGMGLGRNTPVSPDSLAGKLVLMDFYKMDCAVCAQDEAALRAAAEAFADDLVIVRVNLDLPPTGAAMEGPWRSIQGEDGFMSRVAEAYEVLAVPHRVLIARDGVVQAIGEALYGERLEQTLRTAL